MKYRYLVIAGDHSNCGSQTTRQMEGTNDRNVALQCATVPMNTVFDCETGAELWNYPEENGGLTEIEIRQVGWQG